MSETFSAPPARTFALGGCLPIFRLGYGAMRLTGEGVCGPPKDRKQAIEVLRAAVDLGVTFIDTADAYGPYVVEELIAEALHPYPEDLVIGTKGGLVRYGPAVAGAIIGASGSRPAFAPSSSAPSGAAWGNGSENGRPVNWDRCLLLPIVPLDPRANDPPLASTNG